MSTPHDQQISRRVLAVLDADPRTTDALLEVTCLHGAVTIEGTVPSEATRSLAAALAYSVTGVHAVNNAIRVRYG